MRNFDMKFHAFLFIACLAFFLPLAGSDYLMANRGRAIQILFSGLTGPITVNGKPYDGVMPAVEGSDPSLAAILTFVRNDFNGATDSISFSEVAAERKALGFE